jgi:hypothetical protein
MKNMTEKNKKKFLALRKKGRELAKKAGVKPFYFSGKKRAKSRRKKKKTASGSGFRQLIIKGFDMPKKQRKHRKSIAKRAKVRHVVTMHGDKSYLHHATNIGTALIGAIGGSYIANKVPVSAKIKAALPILAGISLLAMVKNNAAKMAGFGMSIAGGLSLARQFMPGTPLLAGDPAVLLIPDNSQGGGMSGIHNYQRMGYEDNISPATI